MSSNIIVSALYNTVSPKHGNYNHLLSDDSME